MTLFLLAMGIWGAASGHLLAGMILLAWALDRAHP